VTRIRRRAAHISRDAGSACIFFAAFASLREIPVSLIFENRTFASFAVKDFFYRKGRKA
jgi:hypothetical protein